MLGQSSPWWAWQSYYDVLAVVGVMIVVDSAIGGASCLELNVFGASGALLFEEGGDDAGGRLDVFGRGN